MRLLIENLMLLRDHAINFMKKTMITLIFTIILKNDFAVIEMANL